MRAKCLMVIVLMVGVNGMQAIAAPDVGVRAGWMRLKNEGSDAFVMGAFLRSNRGRILYWDGSLFYHTSEVSRGVDVEIVPLQLSAMAYLLGRDGLLSPYLLGGGGAYWKRTVGGRNSGSKLDVGWHLGAGLDYAITDRMFLEADIRYSWLRFRTRGKTLADSFADYSHLIGSIGLGFRL